MRKAFGGVWSERVRIGWKARIQYATQIHLQHSCLNLVTMRLLAAPVCKWLLVDKLEAIASRLEAIAVGWRPSL